MSEIIKGIRESIGMTQTKLAESTGLSRKKLYNIEEGKVRLKDEDLDKISSFLAQKMDLSYVAGLFDRASTIDITKIKPFKIHDSQKSPMYISKICFSSRHRILCDIVKNVFKTGAVSYTKAIDRYTFYAHCNSTDTVIDMLLPYIKLKREKLLVLKEFREILEESRDEWRGQSWTDVIVQDKTAKNWWTIGETIKKLGNVPNRNVLIRFCNIQKLESKKGDLSTKKGVKTGWLIAPITNCSEVIERMSKGLRLPYSQQVLDKYEELYQRIKVV